MKQAIQQGGAVIDTLQPTQAGAGERATTHAAILSDFSNASYFPFSYPTQLQQNLVNNSNPIFVRTPGSIDGSVHCPLTMVFPSASKHILANLLTSSFEQITKEAARLEAIFQVPPSERTLKTLSNISYDTYLKFASIPETVLKMVFEKSIERLEKSAKWLELDKLFLSNDPNDIRLWHRKRCSALEKIRNLTKEEALNDHESTSIISECKANYDRAINHHKSALTDTDEILIAERDQVFRDIVGALLNDSMLRWSEKATTGKETMTTLLNDHPEFLGDVLETYQQSVNQIVEQYNRAKYALMTFRDQPENYRSSLQIARSIDQITSGVEFPRHTGFGIAVMMTRRLAQEYGVQLAKA